MHSTSCSADRVPWTIESRAAVQVLCNKEFSSDHELPLLEYLWIRGAMAHIANIEIDSPLHCQGDKMISSQVASNNDDDKSGGSRTCVGRDPVGEFTWVDPKAMGHYEVCGSSSDSAKDDSVTFAVCSSISDSARYDSIVATRCDSICDIAKCSSITPTVCGSTSDPARCESISATRCESTSDFAKGDSNDSTMCGSISDSAECVSGIPTRCGSNSDSAKCNSIGSNTCGSISDSVQSEPVVNSLCGSIRDSANNKSSVPFMCGSISDFAKTGSKDSAICSEVDLSVDCRFVVRDSDATHVSSAKQNTKFATVTNYNNHNSPTPRVTQSNLELCPDASYQELPLSTTRNVLTPNLTVPRLPVAEQGEDTQNTRTNSECNVTPTGLGEINTHLNRGGLTGVYEGSSNSSHGYVFEQAVAPPEFNPTPLNALRVYTIYMYYY